jgi:hypothetical protein
VESLEQRTHLAVSPFSAYMPLVHGAKWVYEEVDDGKRVTETETIAPRKTSVNNEMAFRRISRDSNGDTDSSLENLSPQGIFQLHRAGGMTFVPPIRFPELPLVGERARTQGGLHMRVGERTFVGIFNVLVDILAKERVRVPAGTFSTIKVRMTVNVTVEHREPGVNVKARFKGTDTVWLARGVGGVKAVGKAQSDVTLNGKRELDDHLSSSVLRSYSIPRH